MQLARKSSETWRVLSRVEAEARLIRTLPLQPIFRVEHGIKYISLRSREGGFLHIAVTRKDGRWYANATPNRTFGSASSLISDYLEATNPPRPRVARRMHNEAGAPLPRNKKQIFSKTAFDLGQRVSHIPSGLSATVHAILHDGDYMLVFDGSNEVVQVDRNSIRAFTTADGPGQFYSGETVVLVSTDERVEVYHVHGNGEYSVREHGSTRTIQVNADEIRSLTSGEQIPEARASAGASAGASGITLDDHRGIRQFKRNQKVMIIASDEIADIETAHRNGDYSVRLNRSARTVRVPADEIRSLTLGEQTTETRATAGASGWQHHALYENGDFVMALWGNNKYYLATVLNFMRTENKYRLKWNDGGEEVILAPQQIRKLNRKETTSELINTHECERCLDFESFDLNVVDAHERNCGLERVNTNSRKGYTIFSRKAITNKSRIGDDYPGTRTTISAINAKKERFKQTSIGKALFEIGSDEFDAKTSEYTLAAGEEDEEDDLNSFVLDPTDANFDLKLQPELSMTYLNEPSEGEVANVAFEELFTEHGVHAGVGVFAIRHINENDELLVDYGEKYDRFRYNPIRFGCIGCTMMGTAEEIDAHEKRCPDARRVKNNL
jgi:hypothetical protein